MKSYTWGALALVLLAGCQLPMAAEMKNPNDAKSSNYSPKASDKDITYFAFKPGMGSNPSSIATGVISGTNISVQLPEGTPKNNLIANFTTTGIKVVVNNTTQVSDSTPKLGLVRAPAPLICCPCWVLRHATLVCGLVLTSKSLTIKIVLIIQRIATRPKL